MMEVGDGVGDGAGDSEGFRRWPRGRVVGVPPPFHAIAEGLVELVEEVVEASSPADLRSGHAVSLFGRWVRWWG